MSILDDLSSAIRTVHDSAGPAVVGIGRGLRGSGVVIADGRVLTNAHNLRGDEVTVTFRDGRSTRGTVLRRRSRRRSRRDRRRHRRRHAARVVRRRGVDRRRRLRPRVDRCRRGPGHRRHGVRDRADVPGPGRQPDRRQPRAHSTARSRLLGRPPRRRHGRLLAINTNRIGEGFYLARPADAALRERIDALSVASRRAGRGSGSRSRRRPSPTGSAGRSA